MEKLKNGTEIRYGTLDLKVVERMFGRELTIEEKNRRKFTFSAYGWINTKFEILSEEDEEIDIEAIEEPELGRHISNLEDAIYVISQNEKDIAILKKAVKQLNKQMKEK